MSILLLHIETQKHYKKSSFKPIYFIFDAFVIVIDRTEL